MDTLDFFKRVLPAEGFYCAIVINNGAAPQQAFFSSVDELASNCQRFDSAGNNTYYAVSSFKNRFSRTQANTKLSKSLFIDIDCGPEDKYTYKNQKDGLNAILEFCLATNMPKPMIVSSGRGLHIYWVLEEAIPIEDWQPLADALKNKFQEHGFDFDPSVTADSARVLRPIGTTNPKNGKPVKLLLDADPVTKDELSSILGPAATYVAPMPQQSVRRGFAPKSALASALEIKQDFVPAKPDAIYNNCQQVRWAVDNQDSVQEPLWYALLGVAAHCEDPDTVAKNWSKNHPSYSEGATIAKLRQWQARTTGPTTCKIFEDNRPKGCDKCPLKGNIVTPTMCGRVYEDTGMVEDAPDAVAHKLKLPRPFKYVGEKIVQTIDGTDIEVSPFPIYPTGYGRDDSLGYETVRYKWKRPHEGWQDLVFRQAYLNTKSREFPTAIADQGIVLNGEKQTQGFQYMLRGYMDKLRSEQSMTNLHGTMGWKDDFSRFVIGNRLYKRQDNGVVKVEDVSLSSSTSNMGGKMYSMEGSLEAWSESTSILQSAKLPYHIFALNNSLSAPLWALTGLKGITISLFGESGAGKSIAQLIMQSVWGSPDKLHFAAKFTHNALFNRLGVYCHMPMTIDEATLMENVGDFCYWVTQGRDKARLSRNAVERDSKEWATSVTVSTNISFASKMAASGVETSAQMARLLELEMPQHKLFSATSDAGRKIADFYAENHGYAGDVLVKEFLRLGKAELRRRIAYATLNFEKIYGFKFAGVERFWETALVLQHVAGEIAEGLGLIKYDFRIGIKLVLDQIDILRSVVEENRVTAFDIVKEYLNEEAANILTIMHTTSGNYPPAFDINRQPRGEIKARFDVYRTAPTDKFTRGTVVLVRKSFRKYVSSRGYDFNLLRRELIEAGADATPQSGKATLGKDTTLKAGQHYVIGVNLSHIDMVGYLDVAQQSSDEMTLGQIGIV